MMKSVAKIDVHENAQPIFCKARAVPFAMKKGIQEELDRLEDAGIIRKV